MKKNFTVGLLYLKVNNLGDVVLHDTSKYLIDDYLKKQDIDYQIKSIDIGDKFIDEMKISKKREKLNNILEKELDIYLKIFKNQKQKSKFQLLNEWKRTKHYLLIKNKVFKKLKNVDVIVFAGGGLIKFHQQEFYLTINEITKFANKNHIPVLFTAVGVEGYDENDNRCLILKKAINRSCVKAISIRDDIDTFKKYLTRDIPTFLVADSALYCPETYKVKKEKESNTIGIGVIRPEIFQNYLYHVDEETLLKMYGETALKLKKKGYSVKFFTNGAIRDQKFILKIKEYMKADDSFDEMIEERPKNSLKLVENISKYKIVVGTRLHSNIIAYSLGIPVVGIVWNNKQILFGKLNKIDKYYITKENFNSNYLVKTILDAPNQNMLDQKKYKKTVKKFIDSELEKLIKK